MSRVIEGNVRREVVKKNYHPRSGDYDPPLTGLRPFIKEVVRRNALTLKGNYDTAMSTEMVIQELKIPDFRVWVMRKGHEDEGFSGTVIYGFVSRILSQMARDHQIMRPNQTEDKNWKSDGIYCAIKSTSSGPKPRK